MISVFPDNSRVAFIGDSITAANITLPYIIHAYKTQKIAKNIRFFNCGVAGGTAEFATVSYEKDIKHYNPTHAVIAFAINDSNRDLLKNERNEERRDALVSAYDVYKAKMSELIDKLHADGVKVTLCTPVPYDEYANGGEAPLRGGFALMQGYAEFVRNLAKDKGVELHDQHRVISDLLASDVIISPDRIHPTDHGYFVLAREFLLAQGVEIGEEIPVPQYFAEWHSYVARLRKVLAAECMIVHDFDAPTDAKLARMTAKIEAEDWGQPVFESFIRDYVKDKQYEADLYSKIDELYESKIV